MIPFNYLSGRDSFSRIRTHLARMFVAHAHEVSPTQWQGLDVSHRPEMKFHELMNVTFTHPLNGVENIDDYRADVKPNLPWADDHFLERICGYPINPGVEYANWPWGGSASRFLDKSGQFNHNYMERYWPKYAPQAPARTAADYEMEPGYEAPRRGIRNDYGDLNDLIQSLERNPTSRQEWFPIFHPEDVGDVVGGRKPCSLGYQFWVRGGQLHVYYPMRSCDFYHHMQDDIYLTIRLLLWVLGQCRRIDTTAGHWGEIRPGTFTMHVTSLHVFANDMIKLRKGDY